MLFGSILFLAISSEISEQPPITAAAQTSDSGSSGPSPTASQIAAASILNIIPHPCLRSQAYILLKIVYNILANF